MQGWRKILKANENKPIKKAEVAKLTSDKRDFKTNDKVRDKKGHCLIIQRAIQEEAVLLVNTYAPK